ncbi:MAG: nitroreductase/quinone reductase family protein [Thermoplasmata archaeon]
MAYLTTDRRKTCKPREVAIYFALHGDKFYLLAQRDSQSVQNLVTNPEVRLQIGGVGMNTKATRIDRDPDFILEVMELFREKYGNSTVTYWYRGTERYAVEAEVTGMEPP